MASQHFSKYLGEVTLKKRLLYLTLDLNMFVVHPVSYYYDHLQISDVESENHYMIEFEL